MVTRRYSMRDMEETFGLSRSSIIYYEKLGVLRPEREGAAEYRVFAERDVFRLFGASILKNVGVAPKDLASHLEDPFSDERMDEYLQNAYLRVKRDTAIHEALRRLARLRSQAGTMELADVEAYYAVWDEAEGGYGGFAGSHDLDALLDDMPIGGLGSVWDTDPFDPQAHGRWCRTVSVRNSVFVEGFRSVEASMGGCRCLVCNVFWSDIYAPLDERDRWRERVETRLASSGLERAGGAFSPYCLPTEAGYYAAFCLPVRHA